MPTRPLKTLLPAALAVLMSLGAPGPASSPRPEAQASWMVAPAASRPRRAHVRTVDTCAEIPSVAPISRAALSCATTAGDVR